MLCRPRIGGVNIFFGLAIIWLAAVLWAGHRADLSTASGFAQVIAASLALLLHHT